MAKRGKQPNIIFAVLRDEEREGKRRAKGRTVQELVVFAVDSFNLILARRSGDNPLVGLKYSGRFAQLARHLPELGIDEAEALVAANKAFSRLAGETVSGLTWAELDEKFSVSQRCMNDKGQMESSGRLAFYDVLKAAGWREVDGD